MFQNKRFHKIGWYGLKGKYSKFIINLRIVAPLVFTALLQSYLVVCHEIRIIIMLKKVHLPVLCIFHNYNINQGVTLQFFLVVFPSKHA